MSTNVLPDHVVSKLLPPLAGWLRSHGLVQKPGLAHYFTVEEVASGSAAMELFNEIGVLGDSDFPRFAAELDTVIEVAKVAGEKRRHDFAGVPQYQLHFERRLRARLDALEAESARMDAADLRRCRARVPPPPAGVRHGFSARTAALRDGDPRGREAAEEAEKAKWLTKLMGILKELNAPILSSIVASSRPKELLLAHLGGRRLATLRARMRAWSRYRMWLRTSFGVGHPTSPHHVYDYMLDRRAEPCTRGTLSAAYSAIKFADAVLGLAAESRITSDVGVNEVVKGIIAGAVTGAGRITRGQANAPPIKILMMLEELVCDINRPSIHRMLGYWMLLSAWAVYRFDDHRGLSPQSITESSSGWDLVLTRSKTTGSDKSVSLRYGVLSREAWICHPEWAREGLKVWASCAPFPRSYFLVQPKGDERMVCREMNYVEYSARMRGVLSSLRDPQGIELGAELAMFLRPHSWRCFLTSMAGSMSAPPELLKWLAAWKPRAEEAYIRTSRERTMVLQSTVARLIRFHLGGQDVAGEHGLLDKLWQHMVDRGCASEEVERVVEALRVFPGKVLTTPLWTAIAEPTSGGSSSSAAGFPEPQARKRELRRCEDGDDSSEEPLSREAPIEGYVISISRAKGRRCLHRVGQCYRKPGVHYMTYEAVGPNLPSPTCYGDYCRDCWRSDEPVRGRDQEGARFGSDTGSSRRTSSASSTSSSVRSPRMEQGRGPA